MYKDIFLIFCVISLPYIVQREFAQNSNDSIEWNTEEVEEVKNKNVVLIVADDLGWKDLGCTGSKIYETPNIDQLALDGMLFNKSYAASCVCTPTRASIMTGKYPAKLNIDFIQGANGINSLPLEELTIAEVFKENGYVTGLIGKWHLGSRELMPEYQGFDVTIGKPHSGSPAGGYYLPNKMKLDNVKKGDYLTDKLALEAEKFIVENKNKPFFLYQSFHSVHVPIQAKKSYLPNEKRRMEKSEEKWNIKYSTMIKSLDEAVGRIVKTLKKEGLYDNTIIVFTSDNGGVHSLTDNTPLRGGKGYIFEGGNRIPTIITGKEVQKNKVCKMPIITNDFFPTLLDLCDIELKSNQKQDMDGTSLKSVLLDSYKIFQRRDLFWHFPNFSPQGGMPASSIINGDWKLIAFYERNDEINYELYDLSTDPGESNDLSKIKPKKLEELKDKLERWKEDVDAQELAIDKVSPQKFQENNIDKKVW